MSTPTPVVLTDSQLADGLSLLKATHAAERSVSHRRDAARTFCTGLALIDSDGKITEEGKAANASALARAIVSPKYGRETFIPVTNGSGPYRAALAAGDEPAATARDKAYARHLRDVGNVQVAISEALRLAKPAAAKATRKARPNSDVPTSEPTPDVRTPAASAPSASAPAPTSAPVVTVTTTPAVGKSTSVDHVASILAMSDHDAHVAMARLAEGLKDRPGAPTGAMLAVVAYVKAHMDPTTRTGTARTDAAHDMAATVVAA